MARTTTLDKMTEDVLFCRTEKHLTPTYHDHDLIFSRGYLVSFERTITCKRCTYERTQVLVYGPTGYEVDHSRTRYPADYLNTTGRLRLSQVRTEQMIRAGHQVRTVKIKPKAKAKATSKTRARRKAVA